MMTVVTAGLPHSEIFGSRIACISPKLIAACHVLLRLPPPRHPPFARIVWTPELLQALPGLCVPVSGCEISRNKANALDLGGITA